MAANLIDAISGDLPEEQPEIGKNPAVSIGEDQGTVRLSHADMERFG